MTGRQQLELNVAGSRKDNLYSIIPTQTMPSITSLEAVFLFLSQEYLYCFKSVLCLLQ